MVSNPDNVLNDAAADWYLEDRFVNSNEKIFLAINTEYPVQDELRNVCGLLFSQGSDRERLCCSGSSLRSVFSRCICFFRNQCRLAGGKAGDAGLLDGPDPDGNRWRAVCDSWNSCDDST